MKMLLVDDDPVSRVALRDIFGPPIGWEIIEANDGEQALELMNKGLKPEFCVIDLVMPKMGGVELLTRLRSDPLFQNIKAVVTSATRDRDTILSLARLQVSGYLLKPYDDAKTKATLMPLTHLKPAMDVILRKSARYTLLSVDDDPVMRVAMTEFVQRNSGWDVKFAVDGQDAFDCLYAGLRPDLIITDLNMGNVDGVALLSRIRKDRNFESLKVAVMSIEKNSEKMKQLDGLNVFSFVPKPIDAKQISALLSRVATGA
jgi:CheY-like chemotaxis protein